MVRLLRSAQNRHFNRRQRGFNAIFGDSAVPTEWDDMIKTIERQKVQLEEVLASYKAFREKLASLPPEVVRGMASLDKSGIGPSGTGAISEKQDFAGKAALDCAAIILRERNNEPTHYSVIAKESLRRGYKGRSKGTPEEVETRTVQSFWAAMSRSEELEGVGKGCYRLKNFRASQVSHPAENQHVGDPGIPIAAAEIADRSSVLTIVRESVRQLGHSPFSMHSVIEVLKDSHPELADQEKRPQITSALKRMCELNEIAEVQKGTGRAPSLFRNFTVSEERKRG